MVPIARRTQLYEVHAKSAHIVTFAGFEMPLYYTDIAPEHLAVRNSVGMFDISHMGRVMVTGGDSERFLNHLVTNDVSLLAPKSAHYSVMCTETGGILDDFVVYRLETDRFLVVFNAGNREKDFDWLKRNISGFDVSVEEVSDNVAMIAVQGPNTEKVLQRLSSTDLSQIGRFKCGNSRLAGVDVFLSRTGYTGEDGFEIFVWGASLAKPDLAVDLWKAILENGREYDLQPCGLGARDTLRLEAGLCLYGNDIDENTSPIEAGLGFVVKLQKAEFIAKSVLERQKIEGPRRKRIGIKLLDKGIPRAGFGIYSEDASKIGFLTSGTFSPLLKLGVGMGYVQAPYAQEGTVVDLDIRGKMTKGRISSFPLYDPEKYGYKRKVLVS